MAGSSSYSKGQRIEWTTQAAITDVAYSMKFYTTNSAYIEHGENEDIWVSSMTQVPIPSENEEKVKTKHNDATFDFTTT